VGEWLALTGTPLGAGDAMALGLADHGLAVDQLASAWDALAELQFVDVAYITQCFATFSIAVSQEET